MELPARHKDKPFREKGLYQKAGEAIRTPDIHVGNVNARPHSVSESLIIGDFGRGVAKTVASDVQDEQLKNIVENWSTLPEHIKLAIQALVKAGDV